MKVALFFLLAFGFVALPFLVVLVASALSPPPWLLVGEPGAEWADRVVDGARVCVVTHPTERDAAAAPRLGSIQAFSQSSGAGTFRYTRADDRRVGSCGSSAAT